MRLTKKYLRKLVLEEFKTLLKEEEAEAEGEEETEGEGEGEEETEEEPEEEVKLDAEEEANLSKSADDQILAHIIDFETDAIKSASLVSDDELRPDPDGAPIDIAAESRWYKKPLKDMLFEEGEAEGIDLQKNWVGSPDIDISVFASDVARLVMNYDSLIDMEALIIEKSKNYLLDKYDQETADYFAEIMDVEHDMRSSDVPDLDSRNEVPEAPPAIGSGFASQPGGGA